jgi:hypothetical protein
MDIDGVWQGYGLGDVSPEVSAMKAFFLRKFSTTAAPLQASMTAGGTAAQTYDAATVTFVTEMQTAYGGNGTNLIVNGIMNFSWQVRCGFLPPPKITLFTAQGTGVDMFDTDSPQPYGAALYVQQMYPNNVFVQPVGNYPAAVVPMGASVNDGVAEMVRLCTGSSGPGPFYQTGPKILFGYSQAGILMSHFWRDHVLAPEGDCHDQLDNIIAAVTFGNPCRSPGIANGNAAAGWGMPGLKDGDVTGGISGPDCLTPEQTPGWWYDYVWLGSDGGATELYTNAPVGSNPWTAEAAAGEAGTMIYNIVQNPGLGDILSLVKALGQPIATIEEIYNGITFAAKGPNADHFSYNWLAAILYLQWVVETWTTNYITSGGAVTAPPVPA